MPLARSWSRPYQCALAPRLASRLQQLANFAISASCELSASLERRASGAVYPTTSAMTSTPDISLYGPTDLTGHEPTSGIAVNYIRYSMTSSAVARRVGGTLRPSDLLGVCAGRSAAFAFKDAIYIVCCFAVDVDDVYSVSDQAAVRDKQAVRIHRRQTFTQSVADS